MDFRSLLQSMNKIAEATQETGKGRIHTADPGGYGRKDDEDADGNPVKQSAPAEKRGRGRPAKGSDESGKVSKPDWSGFGVSGKDVKLPKWDKKKTVKHSLKDWIESSEADATLNEEGGITVKPMPGASQIMGADNKPIGTADAATANVIKQASEKGTLNLTGDDEQGQQMNEKWDTKMDTPASEKGKYAGKSKSELLKAYNHLKSTGPHEEGSKPYSNMKELAFAIRAKGKFGKVQEQEQEAVAEAKKAKPDFLDVDKDKNKKESFKKAVKDKEAKKSVKESLSFTEMMQEAGTDVNDMMSELQQDIDTFNKTGHCSDKLEAFLKVHGHTKKKVTDEGSMQDFTTHGMDSKPAGYAPSTTKPAPTSWKVDPIQATTDRAIDAGSRAGSFIRNLVAPKKTFESKDMKDVQLESWEKELNTLLSEGITITSSQGQQGTPDSVSINATDSDAQELLSIVRQAGLGVFAGGNEEATSAYGAPMSGDEGGSGNDPQESPSVVGDGDDMMALIKKMSGIQTGPTAGFGDEEEHEEPGEAGPEGTLTPDYEEEGGEEEEETTDEGNAFGGAVAKAKSDNIPDAGQKINVGGKEYPVKEEGQVPSMDEEGHDHEEGGSCNECGMYEARCVCPHDGEEQVEEEYANEAGHEQMAHLKHMLSQGNDLHREKGSQSVGNPTKVTFETKLLKDSSNLLVDWKKLSGIK